mmetsp:Transcript_11697/g.13522  ORF Transcript_11697/g.13522 Transcript_11697/m.13522 type:complete len:929 (-) Transcript_11697:915-3701(-)
MTKSIFHEYRWRTATTADRAVALLKEGCQAVNAYGISLDEKTSTDFAYIVHSDKLKQSQHNNGSNKKKNVKLELYGLALGNSKISCSNPILSSLKYNNTLTYLDLKKNHIGDKGGVAIAAFLYRNNTLEELILKQNQISDSGAKALAKALKHNDTLCQLDLSRNFVGNKGAKWFVAMLKTNSSVTGLALHHNHVYRERILEKLTSLLSRNRQEKTVKEEIGLSAFTEAVNGGKMAPWGRAKLMVIGQGRVGKTATVRSLLGEEFKQTWISTVGASVTQIETRMNTAVWKKVGAVHRKAEFTTEMAARIAAASLGLDNEIPVKSKRWSRRGASTGTDLAASASVVPENNSAGGTCTGTYNAYSGGSDFSLVSEPEVMSDDTEGLYTCLSAFPTKNMGKRRASSMTYGKNQEIELKAWEDRSKYTFSQQMVNLPPVMKEDEIRNANRSYAKVIRSANESKNDLKYTIWDFGGQKVFYSLHPLFLTSYGVYVLVFDIRKLIGTQEVKKSALHYMKYWLNSVTLYAPGAPIVVVGTFKDSIRGRMDILERLNFTLQLLLAHYPQYVKNKHDNLVFFPIENKTGEGIEILSEVIEAVTRQQECVNRNVSIRWLRCLDYILEENCESWISYNRVVELARIIGIETNEEVSHMLSFFHELGVIVHFTGTPELNSIVTTNPQWLVGEICKVVRDSTLHRYHMQSLVPQSLKADVEALFDHALASRDLLEKLWEKDKVEFMLDIMRQVLLLSDWKFSKTDTLYLVPSLRCDRSMYQCSKSRSDIRVPGLKAIFDFSESFLPVGVFQRLVCLCVIYSGRDKNSQQPLLDKTTSTISFGNQGRIHLCENDEKIYVTFESAQNAWNHLQILLAMMRKLKTGVVSLRWNLELKVDGDYVAYDKVRQKKMKPWFQTIEAAQLKSSSVPNLDISSYLERLCVK